MIYVLITTHPSTRFPGKNALLARYTLDWAAAAALYCHEKVIIVHAGPEPPAWLPPKVLHLSVPGANHADDVRLAEQMLKPAADDVLVLAQLTQPLRHVSLLQQAADMVRATRQTVITASLQPDQAWRVTAPDGTWGEKNQGCVFLHDGTLYAWQSGQSDAIFDRTAKHAGLHTGCRWAMVDIDAPGDLPASLPTLWANALHDLP
jgi:hypothetical protein